MSSKIIYFCSGIFLQNRIGYFLQKQSEMRNLFTLIILATMTFGCGSSNGGAELTTIKVTGSTTVGPLATTAAEEFEKMDSTIKISISEGGSGVGIANLLDGTTDIAMASRDIKESEKLKLDADQQLEEVILALDALSIVVYPGNPIEKLTKEQIRDIFTGRITNWKELEGEDQEIVPILRETSSGTYEYFKGEVLDNENPTEKALSQGSNGGVVQTISQTPGAIGFIGFAFEDPDKAKALSISWDGGESYVEPVLERAMRKEYPLARPLYFYHMKKDAAKVAPFIDFILSERGQEIVREVGYIPVKKN